MLPFAAFAIMSIWIGVVELNRMFTEEFRRDATHDATNIARVFEEHVARAIRETDKTLLLLRTAYEDRPEEFNLSRWTSAKEFKSELVIQYAHIGTTGKMLQSNVGRPSQIIDLSDREHFSVHRDSADDELFISKPVLGRASGKWSIQLSRRLRQSDGSFGGVIVGSIDPAYLTRLYQGIDIGTNGATILVGLDGIVRAGNHGSTTALGQSIKSSFVFQHASLGEAGVVTATDPIDSELRLFGYEAVPGYPLIVLAGISEQELLVKGKLNYYFNNGTGALLTILVMLLFATMHLKDKLNFKVTLLSLERDKSNASNLAKSSFLAMMSHEIRTPMNAIIGLSSTLMNHRLSTTDHHLVTLINQEGDRLLILLNDILDYSKMESGKLHFESTSFAPSEIISSVIAITKLRGQAKGLTVNCHAGPGLPLGLIGDAGRLQQVMLNLVSNSIKFTETGTVTAQVECIEQCDGFAVMKWSVRDTGIGIAPENVSKLFDDFVQADSSINRSFGGSGLGLAICKRIICQMNGTITIESAPEAGTTVIFVVKLPIGEAPLSHNEGTHYPQTVFAKYASSTGKSLRVLIVDDSQTNLLVASEMLQEFDLSIATARDGFEAVTAASKFSYDLILMDMRMPEMDGIQATFAIRAQGGANASVPIVSVTANAFAEDIKSCKEAGMDGFITKPLRRSALLDEMIRVLDSARSPNADSTRWTSQAVSKAADEALDASQVFDSEQLRELADSLGKKRTDEAVRLFREETASRIAKLRQFLAQNRMFEVSREAHSIERTSATFGLIGLSALAADLTKISEKASQEDVVKLVADIEGAFCRGCELLIHEELRAA